MMLNLFSIFDPSTYFFSLNWFSSIIGLFFLPQIYWIFYSRLFYFLNNLLFILWNEFKLILNFKFNLNNLIYLMVFFIFFVFNNFMGLFPYVFTSSSHLIFSLWISLSMWLGFMIFGWVKNSTHMFIHLVPLGTPFMLMFFMVLIELLSNIIRPMTLCIRLVANMVAGHLLLTLLGNFISKFLYFYMFIFIIQIMLLFLEMVVSLIQSYVFIILLILYLKETN
uniref:ATP synthase F0 subunit 6 n=1 Tax=Apanteles gelechiidivoris TaxID=1911542 RepID=UPI00286B67CE|nr:ATP synthase F0 subunit 6 [Apanteles gelechiidivoris]WKW91664.1 ATP synthase F0 subunit 6 [Apanteles gelechiidivoris]WLN31482.1 ATP synthase F0 subunit 6 [Apanteles gelechiidivoris]